MSGGGVRTAPTLVTQFAVPPPPFGMVERPRLSERVHRGLEEPVTLICAPAGSGKTALIASQVPDAAWITLEAADDEPGRLWGAVLTALEIAGAVPPDSSLAALAAPVRESRDTFMPFLLLHTPDTLRVVLTARSDPRVPLHVLRVRGRLAEIRAGDLAFTVEETEQLLAAHGLQGRDDPDSFIAEFAGDDRVVGDYLLAEVLDRQPPRLRAILLRTSLVDRVCGSLADALTDDGHGAETLADLERTNGFVLGVDGHREWFRYHRLFMKLLRTRAERELEGEVAGLHARAARWYAEHGFCVEAIEHAVAAEEWDLALEVVAEHWFELYLRGDAAAVRSLTARIPPERVERDAEVSAALACAALDVADTDMAEVHLAHAEQAA